MIFAHDPQHDFFYLGEEEPTPGFLRSKLDNAPQTIAVDCETISLKERIAIGVSIATSPDCCFYFPLFPEVSPATPWHLLRDPKYCKVYHNAVFDLACMREYEIDTSNVRDTNIMSRLLCYKDCDLLSMSLIHKMEVHDAGNMLREAKVKMMLELPTDVVAKKCMQDSMATLKLYHELLPKTDMPYFLTEMETIPIMDKMSARGILIDQEARLRLDEILESEVSYYRTLCEEIDGFNPGSSQQVSYILAKHGAYRQFKRLPYTRGGSSRKRLSASRKVLEKMDNPVAAVVLNYRQKASLLADYIKPWAGSLRAYTRFHLDAATGRPSSTERNMQNIPPGEPRGIFLPDNVIWTDLDFSQVELRVLAYLSGDKEMQYIFSLPAYLPDGSRNPEADIHQQTASFLGIPRRISKNVNFSMIYGATDQTIAETAGIRDIKRAGELKQLWFAKFPQAGDWIQSMQGQVFDEPYATTLYGRKMRLDFESDDVGSMQRKAVNYPIQGSSAEILKRSLIATKDLDVALQVHDELLIDGYVEEEMLKDKLENIAPLYTPIEVKYRSRWE